MLTKTVLYVSTDGACDLAEVPFNWQHGESLPVDAVIHHFANATEAMAELLLRGKLAQRVHVDAPPPREGERSTQAGDRARAGTRNLSPRVNSPEKTGSDYFER